MEEPATTQAKEEATSSLRVREIGASTTLGTSARTDRKGRNCGRPILYSGRAALKKEQRDIITEERAVRKSRYNWRLIIVTSVAYVTKERVLYAVRTDSDVTH
jgi:hypothetical protein